MVALLTSVRNSPCFGGLRRTKTCHRQLFARPSVFLRYFLHAAKSTNPFPCRELSRFCEPRISAQNYKFALTKLNPFEKLRGFANIDSARRNGGFARTKLNPFAALGGILPAAMPPFLLLTQHFLPLRGLFFGGHAAFLCCLRQPTAALRRLFSYFL